MAISINANGKEECKDEPSYKEGLISSNNASYLLESHARVWWTHKYSLEITYN
jgi:hypothetical protein